MIAEKRCGLVDARQVAACTVAQIEYLVSWNFRHGVNVVREEPPKKIGTPFSGAHRAPAHFFAGAGWATRFATACFSFS